MHTGLGVGDGLQILSFLVLKTVVRVELSHLIENGQFATFELSDKLPGAITNAFVRDFSTQIPQKEDGQIEFYSQLDIYLN
jgi:hypothetical protein